MVAPGFLAVSVGAGRHLVEFQYNPVPFTETLFLVGVGVAVTVAPRPSTVEAAAPPPAPPSWTTIAQPAVLVGELGTPDGAIGLPDAEFGTRLAKPGSSLIASVT